MDKDFVRGQIRWLIEEKCGGTLSHFAKSIEKSPGNVKDWLDKKSFPKEDALEKISNVYGVTREWIRGEEVAAKARPIVDEIRPVPRETIHNRENLLIQLGRAQGEAAAYKEALKEQTVTLRDHVDSHNGRIDEYFEKMDNTFNRLLNVVQNKIETPGEAPGERSQGKVKTSYRPVVPHGEGV
jgi:hypothetical protein